MNPNEHFKRQSKKKILVRQKNTSISQQNASNTFIFNKTFYQSTLFQYFLSTLETIIKTICSFLNFITPQIIKQYLKTASTIQITITISLAIHLFLILVNFGFPVIDRIWNDKAPIIAILVNAQTDETPKNSKFISQVNSNAGGNVDDKVIASSPTDFSEKITVGFLNSLNTTDNKQSPNSPEILKLKREIELLEKELKNKNDFLIQKKDTLNEPQDNESQRLQMDLMTKIEKDLFAYSQRPRKKFIGTQTKESHEALWVEAWQRKIEDYGNKYYPHEARGKIRGELILTVGINVDGSVESVKIDHSSGKALLDEAANNIIALSAPFEPFDASLKKNTDIIYITRLWKFGPHGLRQEAIKAQ